MKNRLKICPIGFLMIFFSTCTFFHLIVNSKSLSFLQIINGEFFQPNNYFLENFYKKSCFFFTLVLFFVRGVMTESDKNLSIIGSYSKISSSNNGFRPKMTRKKTK